MSAPFQNISDLMNRFIQFGNVEEYNLNTFFSDLTVEEKSWIGKEFCQLEWSNHSLQLLSVLQQCGILTATQYILRQADMQHMQMVLGDSLEFQLPLFANFLENCTFSILNKAKLQLILEEFFHQLLLDLLDDPNIISENYIQSLQSLVADEVFELLKTVHLNIFLDMNKSSIHVAFKNIKKWTRSIPPNTTLSTLLQQLTRQKKDILEILFTKTRNPNFSGWKFLVILLHYLSANCTADESALIRRYLRDVFKRFVSACSEQMCIILFVVARVVYNDHDDELESYQKWFKSTIGDMTYVITSDQFKEVMELLVRLLSLETEEKYLQIQMNTSISPPPFCNEIVLNYKSLCKARILEIKHDSLEITMKDKIEDDEM